MKAKAFQKNNVYLKQLSVFGFLAFILLFCPGISLAEEGLSEITPIGDGLYNSSEQTNLNSPDLEGNTLIILNEADVANELDAGVNTGGNNASENNDGGSITTGDANTAVTVINQVNSDVILADGSSLSVIKENIFSNFDDNYLLADESGNLYRISPDGENLIPVGCGDDPCLLDESSMIYIGENSANILNTLRLISNTGQNLTNGNGGAGTITTGDSNVALNLLNILNTHVVISGSATIGYINIFGDWNGNLEIPDEWLPILDNDSDTTLVIFSPGSRTFYLVENNSRNSNLIQVDSNTGGNEANGNSGDGQITTGDSTAKVSVLNLENQTIIGSNVLFFIVNVLGDWNGGSEIKEIIPNDLWGQDSSGNGQNTPGSVVVNNEASVTNDIQISSNTGGNQANNNGGDGAIRTGDSRIIINILNLLNLNIIAGNLRLVLINVLGDWNGSIVPALYVVPGGDDGDDQDGTSGTVQAQLFSSSVISSGRRPRIFLASAASETNSLEDEPVIALDQEIKGDLNARTGSDKKCNWWWIISLVLLLALFGNYILADISSDKKNLDYLLGVTPLVLGVIALWAHNYLSNGLSQSVYCDYLWLIVLLELAVYYILRYRGVRIAKK